LSLNSAFINISNVESCELNVEMLIKKIGDIDFYNINDLKADVNESKVEKLAIQLANQLVQF